VVLDEASLKQIWGPTHHKLELLSGACPLPGKSESQADASHDLSGNRFSVGVWEESIGFGF